MNKLLILFLVCIASISGFSQHKNIDSLIAVTQSKVIDKERASAYQRLAWLHITKNTSYAGKYLDTAAVLYKSLKDIKGINQVLYKRAVMNRFTGNYDQAIVEISEYIDNVKVYGDSIDVADALFQKGNLYQSKGDYAAGLKIFYRALAIYEREKDSLSIGNMHNSIGLIFKNIGQWEDALESYKKSETIQLSINDKENLIRTYNNIGVLYSLKEDLTKGIHYFEKTLTLARELNSVYDIALANQNIGITLFEQNKIDEALEHIEIAYQIQKENNYGVDLLNTLSHLSVIYTNLGNAPLSKKYLDEASALQINDNKATQNFEKAYYKYYESQGNFKESLHHYKLFSNLKDSIINTENKQILNGLKIQYETEKKDKTILQNKLDLEKSQAKTQLMTLLIISLLIASMLLWFIFQQRQKRIQQQLISIKKEQEVRTLESLIEGEEKERLRIAKELHDGVNGDLSAIKYKLSSLLKMNNEVITEAVAMIDNSCKQVRAISHNLVPPSLKDFNLTEAIENYCEHMNGIHQPKINFQNVGEHIDLNKKIEVNIFRIIQELVTNAIKHAEAKTIDVQISNSNNILLVTVEDNGTGYTLKAKNSMGIGLGNIKSRVEYLNAKLDVVTNEKGTFNTVEIDLKNLEQ